MTRWIGFVIFLSLLGSAGGCGPSYPVPSPTDTPPRFTPSPGGGLKAPGVKTLPQALQTSK